MAHFGGGTRFGGGARFGGGPSLLEAWRTVIIGWLGRGALDTSEQTNAWKLASVEGGQGEGAQVDGERVYSEGIAPLAVETLAEWESICNVESITGNLDARRLALLHLWQNVGEYTSLARAENVGEDVLGSSGTGLDPTVYGYACTHAQAQAAGDSGQGVRYWCLLVPAWSWLPDGRTYYNVLLSWCQRSDPFQCEASLPVTNDGGAPPEPCFYLDESLLDRDVLRD